MSGTADPDLGQQPLPEPQRLGVRVVHPEDRDPVVDPQPDHPEHLGVDALRVVVEVDRVDVLVLLRRVLGVGDGAVGPGGEPLRVLLHPRVIGRGLQGQVQRDLHAELAGPAHERVEVLERAQVRVDRVVAAVRRSRSPTASRGRSRWPPACCSGPSGTWCRSGAPAAGTPRRSPCPPRRSAAWPRCGTSPRPAGAGLPGRPGRPRTGGRTHTRSRTGPVPGRPARAAPGTGSPARAAAIGPGCPRWRGRRPRRAAPRAAAPGCAAARPARAARSGPPPGGWPRAAGGSAGRSAANSSAPSVSISSTSWPAGILMAASRCQVAIGSAQASTWKRHSPSDVTVRSAPYRSVPGASSRIRTSGPRPRSGSLQHRADPDDAVALAEHGRAHREGLARHGLDRSVAALDRGLEIKDRDSSNHAGYATDRGAVHASAGPLLKPRLAPAFRARPPDRADGRLFGLF